MTTKTTTVAQDVVGLIALTSLLCTKRDALIARLRDATEAEVLAVAHDAAALIAGLDAARMTLPGVVAELKALGLLPNTVMVSPSSSSELTH